MNRENAIKMDEYIDTIIDKLKTFLGDAKFIITKETESHKSKFEDTKIDMEVINLRDYIDAYTKRIVNLTNYDNSGRPIQIGNICYKYRSMDDPDIRNAKVTEFGNIFIEYNKNSDTMSRCYKSQAMDGAYFRKNIDNIVDINGHILERRIMNDNSRSITNITEIYNDDDTVARIDEINDYGKTSTEYNYNSSGKAIIEKYTRFDRAEETVYQNTITYDYDENDRLVRVNISNKVSRNGEEFKVVETQNLIYSWYNIDGFTVRLKSNISRPKDNMIRIFVDPSSTTRYIDYNFSKRRITIVDDTISTIGLSFSEDMKSIVVDYANIESINRCLYYNLDKYNNLDNIKCVVYEGKEKEHYYSTEYRGKIDSMLIVKIATNIFTMTFNMDYTMLYSLSKQVSAMANIQFQG